MAGTAEETLLAGLPFTYVGFALGMLGQMNGLWHFGAPLTSTSLALKQATKFACAEEQSKQRNEQITFNEIQRTYFVVNDKIQKGIL